MFQSVLRVHGYAAIESGSVIKIVPTQGAKQGQVDKPGQTQRHDQLRTVPVGPESIIATWWECLSASGSARAPVA